MFKIIGSVAKGIFKGVRDFLPVAQIADSLREKKIRDALGKIKGSNANDQKSIQQAVAQVYDILDDGRVNDSYDKAKAEATARIITGGLPVLAYIIHGIATGNWIFF